MKKMRNLLWQKPFFSEVDIVTVLVAIWGAAALFPDSRTTRTSLGLGMLQRISIDLFERFGSCAADERLVFERLQ